MTNLSPFYAEARKLDGTPQKMLAMDDEVPECSMEVLRFIDRICKAVTVSNEDGLNKFDLRLRTLKEERIGNESVPLDKPQYVVTLVASEDAISFANIAYNKFSYIS